MNTIILTIAMILAWITVVAGLYQRIFLMPKWFEDPPASFERIRAQSKSAKSFWIPLSILMIACVCISLILYWYNSGFRVYLFGALGCFGLTGALTGAYFVKEVLAFSAMPVDAPRTPDLLRRTTFWLKWTTIRDILQVMQGIFITIAYNHS